MTDKSGKISVGDKLTLGFTDTTILASGVARHDGAVIFADGAIEGDTAEVTVTEAKKNYIKAHTEKIITPSEHRCEPDCPIYGLCGGCSFRHITADYERIMKKRAVEAAFRRSSLGRVKVNDTVSLGGDRYRNKTVVHFGGDGRLGYYRESSYDTVFPSGCDCKLHPAFYADVLSFCERYFKSVGAKPTYIYIRSSDSGEFVITVGANDRATRDALADFATKASAELPSLVGVFSGEGTSPEDGEITHIWGNTSLSDVFCGLKMSVSPAAFYQVNKKTAERLASIAADYAAPIDGELIADLYCGTGILGMVTAKNAPNAEVIGVEINEAAVINAKENAKRNGLGNISFFAGDSKDFAHHLGERTLDAAIIDPPRKGCSTEMIGELVRLSPKRIVYVSCNPATLARDISALAENGYAVIEATPVDMFPRTGHVECVTLLTLNFQS